MASQNVNFTTADDTGENNAASIAPYENGERAVSEVFNRPPEALRVRTETLRTSVEGLQYLGDADRAMVISGGGDITWNVAGNKRVVITSDLVIRPFLAPATCTAAKYQIGPVLLQTRADSSWVGSATPTVPRAYSGANKISVTVTGSDGAGPVTVSLPTSANPRDNIVINIDTNPVTGTTALQLVNALNAVADIAGSTGLGVLASVAVADEGVILASVSPSVITAEPQYMTGALDAEEHIISAAGLTAFFNADAGANLLDDGDTLALWYPELVMSSGGGRRQSINAPPELSGGRDGAAADAVLFKVSRFPERALGALPVCTVADGKLVFLTGERLEPGSSGVLGGATADNVTYAGSNPEAWADGTYLPASSVETALDTVVEVLGDATGGSLVGFDGHTNLTATSVSGAIKELDAEKAGLYLPNVFTETNRFEADTGVGVHIEPAAGTGLYIKAPADEAAATLIAGVTSIDGLSVRFDTGNATAGVAITALGGSVGGIGVDAVGGDSTGDNVSNDGTGVGVKGQGGAGAANPTGPGIDVRGGSGVEGYGGSYGGVGVKGQGGTEGTVGGPGVQASGGVGTATGGAGVIAVGGEPNGTGVLATGAAGGGYGVWGLGFGADKAGVRAQNASGFGIEAIGDIAGKFSGTSKGIDVTGDVAITATGDVTLNGTTVINGTTTVNDEFYVNAGIIEMGDPSGSTLIKGATTLQGSLQVNDDFTVPGLLEVSVSDGEIRVQNDIVFNDSVTVSAGNSISTPALTLNGYAVQRSCNICFSFDSPSGGGGEYQVHAGGAYIDTVTSEGLSSGGYTYRYIKVTWDSAFSASLYPVTGTAWTLPANEPPVATYIVRVVETTATYVKIMVAPSDAPSGPGVNSDSESTVFSEYVVSLTAVNP